ncbi:hypothetical protein PsorP6_004002 [Peronosclerospora sorghi]|uniref:Uncharacterized protein n=1 Tax=Peronosclerospora sorghi TaxID=230839 RepID=A0ACC0VQL6_9STRA|nr:hypothetical protein PsorP6_004002 [Peronosclerospora sorghi]
MLILPLDEDTLLFRLCLYYGLLVLLLEVFMPLLFQRRVRIEIPRLALPSPAVPLSTREFQHRLLELQQQLAALQRAIAGTPVQSSQKRQRKKMASRVAVARSSTSPSPVVPSSVKAIRPKLSQSEKIKRIINKVHRHENEEDRRTLWREKRMSRPSLAADSMHEPSQSPMAISSAMTTCTVQHGGFSFNEVFEKSETDGDMDEHFEPERAVGIRANITVQRRKESSLFFSGKRPLQLVSKDENVSYEIATRLETPIRELRRQRSDTMSHRSPPPSPVEALLSSESTKLVKHSPAHELTSTVRLMSQQCENKATQEDRMVLEQSSVTVTSQSEKGKAIEKSEEKKELKQSRPLTDFEAFCASFVAGGSAVAQQAVAKRKYRNAFEVDDTQANDASSNKVKSQRTVEQETRQLSGDSTTEILHGVDKRTHREALGSVDNIDHALSPHQILAKRKYDEAFKTTVEQDHTKDITPQIARRISFGGKVDSLGKTPSKAMPVHRSDKCKRKQPLGMIDDDDEDAELWRDDLSFRPHRFGL